jgi:hypothetical protein
MEKQHHEEASALVAQHGRRALQMVIDQLVIAIRGGDEQVIARWDRLLREVERKLRAAGETASPTFGEYLRDGGTKTGPTRP